VLTAWGHILPNPILAIFIELGKKYTTLSTLIRIVLPHQPPNFVRELIGLARITMFAYICLLGLAHHRPYDSLDKCMVVCSPGEITYLHPWHAARQHSARRHYFRPHARAQWHLQADRLAAPDRSQQVRIRDSAGQCEQGY
jgi:hypothetical protein